MSTVINRTTAATMFEKAPNGYARNINGSAESNRSHKNRAILTLKKKKKRTKLTNLDAVDLLRSGKLPYNIHDNP